MDFTVSLRYPLFYEALQEGHKFDMLPFFSFTGRMGQYVGSARHSSPVVTEQFNPKLYFRVYTSKSTGEKLGTSDSKQDYYDVGYAHEANGQYVDSVAVFNSTAASVGGPEIAQDYISQVDGIRLKVTRDFDWSWFKGATLFYITGYKDIGRWNTFRAELGFTPLSNLMGLPIVLWAQSGYNVNVTQYYRNAWSVGLAASFETYQ